MNGDALILWAKTHDPDMKTILFSNHPEVAKSQWPAAPMPRSARSKVLSLCANWYLACSPAMPVKPDALPPARRAR